MPPEHGDDGTGLATRMQALTAPFAAPGDSDGDHWLDAMTTDGKDGAERT